VAAPLRSLRSRRLVVVSPLISLTREVAFLKSNCLSELLSDESLVSLAEFVPAREIADHGCTWPMLNLNFLNLTGKSKPSNKSTFFFIFSQMSQFRFGNKFYQLAFR
jgi:hypothetical protein